jgi:Tfp pilus assembly protein PilE
MRPHLGNKTEKGFTLVGLISFLCVLCLLMWVLTPLARSSERSRSFQCMANLRQLARAMHLYTEENGDVFPAHRNNGLNTSVAIPTNWWGVSILAHAGGDTNLFRCSLLRGTRTDNRVRWTWRFDAHSVGYGYNSYFLGLHPYPAEALTLGGVRFDTAPWFKRSSVVRPAENLLLADTAPSTSGSWTSSLWWPAAGMDPNRPGTKEGVATRHDSFGSIAFNDGHAEFRRNARINPPRDPATGAPIALTNVRYWDPLQRSLK